MGMEWVMPSVTEDCSGYGMGHAWCYLGIAVGREWVMPGVTEDCSG